MKIKTWALGAAILLSAGAVKAEMAHTSVESDTMKEYSGYHKQYFDGATPAIFDDRTGLTWLRSRSTIGYSSIERNKQIGLGFKVANEREIASLLVSAISSIDERDYFLDGDFLGFDGFENEIYIGSVDNILLNDDGRNLLNTPSSVKEVRSDVLNLISLFGKQSGTWENSLTGFYMGDDGNLDALELYVDNSTGDHFIRRIDGDNVYYNTTKTLVEGFMDADEADYYNRYHWDDIVFMVNDVSAPAAFGSLALLGLAGLRRKSK